MTKPEAQLSLQEMIAEIERRVSAEIMPLAAEHSIEFSLLGMTYHLFPRAYSGKTPTWERWNKDTESFDPIPYPPARRGLLVSDDEWYSSTYGCSSEYWAWYFENWPEDED